MFGLKYKDCVWIKKWLAVNASQSLMWSRKVRRGRLLKVHSTLIKNVLNDSSYTGRSLRTDFNDRFLSFTINSQEPPIYKLDGGLNFQVTPLLIKEFSILVLDLSIIWKDLFRRLWNFVIVNPDCFWLSSSCHEPLIKARRKLSVIKSPSKSKCTARGVKQAKTAP